MNWELAEYFLSKFYTVSRAVSTEDATWLFHNLLCALSPLSAEHLQLFPWSDVQTKVKMRSTQIPIPIFFIFYLSYFVYYTMGVRRRGEGGKTAPKYSEKNLIALRVRKWGPLRDNILDMHENWSIDLSLV